MDPGVSAPVTPARAPGVVVGTDGTATASQAVTWAAAEARVRGVPLVIVHAAPYATADHPALRRRTAGILGRAHALARRREPGVPVRTERSEDSAVPALVHASSSAELLVVGMVGGHTGDTLVPSIAPALTARAHCPVAVVRSDHRPATPRQPVVVGVEDLAADAAAVTAGFADAERHGSPLVLVQARRGADPGARSVLVNGLAPWRARHPGVPVEVRVAHGGAVDQLLQASSGARLLVVGTAGHAPAARAVLGSTSRILLRHSLCPVTVVRRDPTPVPAATAGGDAGLVRS